MDVWMVFTPVLKVLLYLAGLAVVGTKLFDLHFSKFQTIDNMEYCNFLSKKSFNVIFECHQFSKVRKLIFGKSIKYPNSKILGHCDTGNTTKTCPNFDVKIWCRDKNL